nr:uncharacterized protein LOC106838703 isoform X2 [Equus asinus]
MEFRKLSVTQQFRPGLAARLHRVAARKQEGGGGGVTEFARGQQRRGPPVSRLARVQAPGRERRPLPCNDFIFSEERPPGPLLPRARFGPVLCAGGPNRTRPRSPQVAAGRLGSPPCSARRPPSGQPPKSKGNVRKRLRRPGASTSSCPRLHFTPFATRSCTSAARTGAQVSPRRRITSASSCSPPKLHGQGVPTVEGEGATSGCIIFKRAPQKQDFISD